jgi:neopullulanase
VNTLAVREFLWDIACHWIEFGVDGWRLDVPADIDDDDFWREFRRRVKGINPEAYIVGEIWHDARRWLQGDQFDAVMNYLFARACLGFFVGDNLQREQVARCGYKRIDALDAGEFASEIARVLALYPRSVNKVQYNLLGSHDTPRFKTLSRGDNSAYRLATLFQMTFPGAPSIYYGDEIGLEGQHDPGCRGGFPWDEQQWDQGLRDYIQRCIALRHEHPALRRGDLFWLTADQGVVAYARQLGAETLVIVLNGNRHPVTLTLPVERYLADGAALQDAWGDTTLRVIQGQIQGIHVPARSGQVLRLVGAT